MKTTKTELKEIIKECLNEELSNKSELNETCLSKLYTYNQQYDMICISSYKYVPDILSDDEINSQYEYEQKYLDRLGWAKSEARRNLRTELKGRGYNIVAIKGFYQYNEATNSSKEDSFAVFNVLNNSNFEKDLLELAKDYEQNSILSVPKGTGEGTWIYTGIDLSEKDKIDRNHKYGDREYQGKIHYGTKTKEGQELSYSLINGRPFQVRRNNKDIVIDEGVWAHFDNLPIAREDSNHLKYFKNKSFQGIFKELMEREER